MHVTPEIYHFELGSFEINEWKELVKNPCYVVYNAIINIINETWNKEEKGKWFNETKLYCAVPI